MYVDGIILYMMTDTKLRSFNCENPNIYQKFKEIQLQRGKTTTQRLNELIAQDVKEADPNFKELTAIRSKNAPDIIIPNPFVLDQTHGLPKWREYLLTLTKKEHSELYNYLIALKLMTSGFNECVDSD